jgi:formylglycine-generating enzyme required for sulfatase activity
MFKKLYCPALIMAAVILCASSALGAGLVAADAPVSLEQAVNPHPAKDDLILPMPGGASMAFRAIAVQSDGFLWDMSTMFGCDSCDRGQRDYYERRYQAAISGPFVIEDFPFAWRAKLPRPLAGRYFYFLMGKYEVSRLQWKIIMEGVIPGQNYQLNSDDASPQTNISWFEGVEFARKYTQWLLDNHPDLLPRFHGDSKNIGYLRLPTELEWEYAARGAHKVNRDSLRQEDFFVMPAGAAFGDYAVYRPENAARIESKALNIGSRKPNPAGLYDMAGNAAEITLDAFHFSLGGRLHGSAGGFVRKGGSYLSGQSEIMPGRREEVAFFQDSGASFSKDMGLRLALSGINTPGGERPAQLEREWATIGEGAEALLDQGKNLLPEIDRLIAATNNYAEKENLIRLRGVIKDNNIALERQNLRAAEGLIHTSLYMIQSVRNYAMRHKLFINEIAQAKLRYEGERMAGFLNDALRQQHKANLEKMEMGRQEMTRSLNAALSFYRTKVEEATAYPAKMFSTQLLMVKEELANAEDLHSRQILQALATYQQHVELMQQGRRQQLDRKRMLRDILPDNLREGIEGL